MFSPKVFLHEPTTFVNVIFHDLYNKYFLLFLWNVPFCSMIKYCFNDIKQPSTLNFAGLKWSLFVLYLIIPYDMVVTLLTLKNWFFPPTSYDSFHSLRTNDQESSTYEGWTIYYATKFHFQRTMPSNDSTSNGLK